MATGKLTNEEKEMKIVALMAERSALMSNLAANSSDIGDWKVIKIYEARMQGKEDPYDFNDLMEKREAARVRIREINKEIEELQPVTE